MKNRLLIQKETFEKLYEVQKIALDKLEIELTKINTKEEKKYLCELYIKVYTGKEIFRKNLDDILNQLQLVNDDEEEKE